MSITTVKMNLQTLDFTVLLSTLNSENLLNKSFTSVNGRFGTAETLHSFMKKIHDAKCTSIINFNCTDFADQVLNFFEEKELDFLDKN